MCGIVGIHYTTPEQHVSEQTVRAMCRQIVHRGPDDEGLHLDGNVGLGMRRLAIIDLANGRQPMHSDDHSVHVVYNGEIYNHTELRRQLESHGHQFRTLCDTEVLVHGYRQWGDDLPKHLNGMFAFSIWDTRRRRLLLARDHLGIKPLYLYRDPEKLVWGSEIKAILAAPGVRAEMDESALFEYLRFGYVPAPRTMFRNITKVPPATIVAVEGEQVETNVYWDLDFTDEQADEGEFCEQLRATLDESVKSQLMSDVSLGAFLSGGLDSSAIVATMSRLGVSEISTYAIGFGDEDAFHSELSKAASVARQFGTTHHEILVEPDVADLFPPLIRQLDEPFTDTSFLVTYLVSKLARETVTVILSGVGGDELFGGYRRHLGPLLHDYYRWVPGPIHRGVIRPAVNRLPVDRGSRLKSAFRHLRGFVESADAAAAERYQSYVDIFGDADGRGVLSDDFASTCSAFESDHVAECYRKASGEDDIDRMLYADCKTSLVDSLLTFTDKMSMAVSLEARVPLLDLRMVELAARVPGRMKVHRRRGLKHIFKRALEDRLPEDVLRQKKQGFGTPISRWFRSSLQPLLRDLLSPDRIAERGYFDPDAVQRLTEEHMQQRADNSERLLALLTVEVWQQEYVDNADFSSHSATERQVVTVDGTTNGDPSTGSHFD